MCPHFALVLFSYRCRQHHDTTLTSRIHITTWTGFKRIRGGIVNKNRCIIKPRRTIIRDIPKTNRFSGNIQISVQIVQNWIKLAKYKFIWNTTNTWAHVPTNTCTIHNNIYTRRNVPNSFVHFLNLRTIFHIRLDQHNLGRIIPTLLLFRGQRFQNIYCNFALHSVPTNNENSLGTFLNHLRTCCKTHTTRTPNKHDILA
mmetsp:Transcript_30066/g.47786  ORF Transcript_30066/g.47786 Transcript_30066/m.47786 type:complete len:200 (+) Transcript_30066:1319-1918(+)